MNWEQDLTAALKQSGPSDKVLAADQQEQLQQREQTEEPWPELVQLHQPPESSQMLLPEYTSGIAVRTYLRLCRLPFVDKTSVNTEFMSNGGRLTGLPLLRLGQFQVVAEFEPIVQHVVTGRPSNVLAKWLSEKQSMDMRCMVNYVDTVFTLAEVHVCYVDRVNYRLYTAERSVAAHPWLLRQIQRLCKQRSAMRLLRTYQWQHMNADQVLEEVSACCEALIAQLSEHGHDSGFLCGPQPCELDALVFGHVAGILNTPLPNRELAELLYTYPRLVAHCRRIDASLYGGKLLTEQKDSDSEKEEERKEQEQAKKYEKQELELAQN